MAIAQAMCTAFKQELLLGTHNFATNGNAFKLALYAEGSGGKSSTTATLGATTTAFTTTGEVASSGTYATGGGTLTKVAPIVIKLWLCWILALIKHLHLVLLLYSSLQQMRVMPLYE